MDLLVVVVYTKCAQRLCLLHISDKNDRFTTVKRSFVLEVPVVVVVVVVAVAVVVVVAVVVLVIVVFVVVMTALLQ